MGAIIWLASYPKSGNTWLRAFLHNLLRNPERPVSINRLDTFCLGESQNAWYRQVAGRDPLDLSPEEIAALRPRVHAAMTRSQRDSVFVKVHNRLGTQFGQPLVSMEHTAGAIYVVRNPLDVCLSMTSHYGLDIDGAIDRLNSPGAATEATADNVAEYYGSWSQHVESWTGRANPQLHIVRYEDLVARPNESFAAIAAFLGLSPDRARLRKAIRFSEFRELRRQESREGFRERSQHADRFFRVGKPAQWRTALQPAQVERIVEAHRSQMQKFGYLPESAPETSRNA